jgi:lipid-binding SYLF domain-containing protein
MRSFLNHLTTASILVAIAAGCQTPNDKPTDSMAASVKDAKAEFLKKDDSLKKLFDSASGYVLFPAVAKGALGVGAARGSGQLFQKGSDAPQGEAVMTQVTVGFQAGGQSYAELIFFEDQTSLDNFKKGNFEFSAQVSAVAVTAGAGANAKYEKGVMVLTMAHGGLMYEASVGGQKFDYQPYKLQ